MTAPTKAPLPKVELAAPTNAEALGEVPVVTLEIVVLLEVVTRVKFAHVRRVALLACMTIDLSPKKYGDPGWLERYRSEYLKSNC